MCEPVTDRAVGGEDGYEGILDYIERLAVAGVPEGR